MKEAKEPMQSELSTLDEQTELAYKAMNDARVTKALGDVEDKAAWLNQKKKRRQELAAAARRFDAEMVRIDKLRKEQA